MSEYTTVFGSLDDYEKGRVIVIDDDPKAYVFSNVFEVANSSKPYEKVAVGKNLEYVLEVIRCEGMSEWRVTPHDEFALVMDGTVVIELLDPDEQLVDPAAQGSVRVDGEPAGKKMGTRHGVAWAPDDAARRQVLPVPLRRRRCDPAANHRGPGHDLSLGRHLPDRLRERTR